MAIPLKIYDVFPAEPENRRRLLLNTLRHDPIQVILALYLHLSTSPDHIKSRIKREHEIDVPEISQYFRDVLENAHLVRKVSFPDRVVYEQTRWAHRYGVPAAQFTLDFFVDKEFSLGDIFGRHIVQDQPTTFRRYRMLKKLYENGDKSTNASTLQRDLMAASQTILSDVKDLEGLGLVAAQLVDVDKFISSKYRWRGGSPTQIKSNLPYVVQVARALYGKGARTVKDIVMNTGLDSQHVFSAIRPLMDEAFVGSAESRHIDHQWDIGISPEGKRLWEDYFARLGDLCSGKNLAGFHREIPASYATKALQRYERAR